MQRGTRGIFQMLAKLFSLNFPCTRSFSHRLKFGTCVALPALIFALSAAADEVRWDGNVKLDDYDCQAAGHETVVIAGAVILEPETAAASESKIRIRCDGLRFEVDSVLETAADLDLRIDGEVCGPIRIIGTRGDDGAQGAAGRRGPNGANGNPGATGPHGRPAVDTSTKYPTGRSASAGGKGGRGDDGIGGESLKGEDGIEGDPGLRANNITLLARNFCTSATIEMSAIGGDGGRGGDGGIGGKGGDGGVGGTGGRGGNAAGTRRSQHGGPGGDGGDGGDGGPGGTGGNGGPGGDGGNIIVGLLQGGGLPVEQPDFDVRGGLGGKPGKGGEGGPGGAGGKAGCGGQGGSGKSVFRGGSRGACGTAGLPGEPGDPGEPGQFGPNGKDGTVGDGTWGVLDENLFNQMMNM